MTTTNTERRLRAVVFDWAGTTVDFGCRAPVDAFQRLFEWRGVPVAEADVRRFMGYDKREHLRSIMALPHVAARWEEVHGALPGREDARRLYRALEQLLQAAVERFADPIPGVPELVGRMKERGLSIGSTTGYIAGTMEVLAPRARSLGYRPDVLVTPDEVPAGRPAPYMCYLNALRLQAYPMEALVKVGDTVADIREGRNAGMWTVGVAIGGSDLGLGQEQVDALPPDALAEKVAVVQERHRETGAHFVLDRVDELEGILDTIEETLAAGGHPALAGTHPALAGSSEVLV
jgi:phosphonoacetaldehyde hydrolase